MSFLWGSPKKAVPTPEEIEKLNAIARTKPLHENVWCDGCSNGGGPSLTGFRFKCLICPNIDLCKACFTSEKNPQGHTQEHTMVCFPLAAPDALMTHTFEGLTCQYCDRENFYGSAYSCTTCPPAAAGKPTLVWCESCELKCCHNKAHPRVKRIPQGPPPAASSE